MKSIQRMLGFMCMITAVQCCMSKFNTSDGYIPQRYCSKFRRKKGDNEKMTPKQRKARKKAKNNKRKCKKR